MPLEALICRVSTGRATGSLRGDQIGTPVTGSGLGSRQGAFARTRERALSRQVDATQRSWFCAGAAADRRRDPRADGAEAALGARRLGRRHQRVLQRGAGDLRLRARRTRNRAPDRAGPAARFAGRARAGSREGRGQPMTVVVGYIPTSTARPRSLRASRRPSDGRPTSWSSTPPGATTP